jgi:hypothetical protein
MITVLSSRKIASIAVGLMLVTLAAQMLPQGSASTSPSLSPTATYTSTDWASWASIAWGYYAPGVGVNSNTGLHRANLGWNCFADWDLGTYIYATIYARKLGLITDGSGSGDWQFKDRINKILNFLTTRPLGSGTWPYQQYTWDTKQPCWGAASTGPTGVADSGRLLAALYALKNYDSTYTTQVGNIVARSKSAYDTMGAWSLSGDYYGYLAAEGFAAWGYSETTNLNKIDAYSGSYIQTAYGENLPKIGNVAEPVNHLLLENATLFHKSSPTLVDFAGRVMSEQEGRNVSQGLLTAWSEGGYAPDPGYIYEVIVDNDGSTWVLKNCSTPPSNPNPVCDQSTHPPLAYAKVAFAYLALYGENAYTLALVNAGKNLATASYGFGEGTYENGQSAYSHWGNLGFYSDKTNEFILAAANRALPTATTMTQLTSTVPTANSTSSTLTEYAFSGIALIIGALILVVVVRRFSGKKSAPSQELISNHHERFLL